MQVRTVIAKRAQKPVGFNIKLNKRNGHIQESKNAVS
jgi:hypothetical protein